MIKKIMPYIWSKAAKGKHEYRIIEENCNISKYDVQKIPAISDIKTYNNLVYELSEEGYNVKLLLDKEAKKTDLHRLLFITFMYHVKNNNR